MHAVTDWCCSDKHFIGHIDPWGLIVAEHKRDNNNKSHFVFLVPTFEGILDENIVINEPIFLEPAPNNF